MIRTLHWYLWRELVKVTALALTAFTILMTVFAIIEPLRKRGLGTEQVVALFGYTVPVMLSLTLPIAALFAATLVYGRFSQDNEFLACRASGVATLSVMKPALVLGGGVTIAALLLSNFVAPQMATIAELAVEENVIGIVSQQFRRQGYVEAGSRLIHADDARQVGRELELHGVVAVDTKDPQDVRVLSASKAYAYFDTYEGQTYVTIYLIDPAAARRSRYDVGRLRVLPLESPVDNPITEEPSWYNWHQLVEMLRNPWKNRQIRRKLTEIRRTICYDILARRIAATINAGKPYQGLAAARNPYVIRAASARIDRRGGVRLLSGPPGAEQAGRVEVTVLRDGRAAQVIAADNGTIEAAWSARANASLVTIELRDNVDVRFAHTGQGEPIHPDEWAVGQLAIPKPIVLEAENISLKDVYSRENLTTNPRISEAIKHVKNQRITKLKGKIIAEMHSRFAYGLSCFLMVSVGAALGLMFRGGQFISAFALAALPGAVVIVMLIMGKEMVRNPLVPAAYGLAAIWGGMVALAAANVFAYARLVRR